MAKDKERNNILMVITGCSKIVKLNTKQKMFIENRVEFLKGTTQNYYNYYDWLNMAIGVMVTISHFLNLSGGDRNRLNHYFFNEALKISKIINNELG